MNTNVSIMRLLVKKFLFRNSISKFIYMMPFIQIKNFFLMLIWAIYSFSVNGADSNVSSNILLLRKTGRVNSEIDLLVSIGISNSSIRLINLYSLVKVVFTVKYIINFVFILWHAAKDLNRKLFSASILQLQSMLLLFHKIISLPLSSTVRVISVLLK